MATAFEYPELSPEQKRECEKRYLETLDKFERELKHLFCLIPKEEIQLAIKRGLTIATSYYELPDCIFIPELESKRGWYEKEINLVKKFAYESLVECLIKGCSEDEAVENIYADFLHKQYITPYVEKCYTDLKKRLKMVVPSIIREWRNLTKDNPSFNKMKVAPLFAEDRFNACIEPLFVEFYTPLNEYGLLWSLLEDKCKG